MFGERSCLPKKYSSKTLGKGTNIVIAWIVVDFEPSELDYISGNGRNRKDETKQETNTHVGWREVGKRKPVYYNVNHGSTTGAVQ